MPGVFTRLRRLYSTSSSSVTPLRPGSAGPGNSSSDRSSRHSTAQSRGPGNSSSDRPSRHSTAQSMGPSRSRSVSSGPQLNGVVPDAQGPQPQLAEDKTLSDTSWMLEGPKQREGNMLAGQHPGAVPSSSSGASQQRSQRRKNSDPIRGAPLSYADWEEILGSGSSRMPWWETVWPTTDVWETEASHAATNIPGSWGQDRTMPDVSRSQSYLFRRTCAQPHSEGSRSNPDKNLNTDDIFDSDED